MNALLIDLDGVLYQGDEAIPGAAETLGWMSDRAIPHAFVTNTTSKPRQDLVAKLETFGLRTRVEQIYTPAVAASRWLAANAPGPVALFVPEVTRGEFWSLPQLAETAQRGAGAVVLGDLGDEWDFARLNRAFRLLMEEPPPILVALGMTRYWRAADGLRLDVAPFVKALEHATNCETVVLGKPALQFFEAALVGLGCSAPDAVMIGDDIVGDVQGAQRAGIRGVLVKTGKFRAADLAADIQPDAVLESIAQLPRWWMDNVD